MGFPTSAIIDARALANALPWRSSSLVFPSWILRPTRSIFVLNTKVGMEKPRRRMPRRLWQRLNPGEEPERQCGRKQSCDSDTANRLSWPRISLLGACRCPWRWRLRQKRQNNINHNPELFPDPGGFEGFRFFHLRQLLSYDNLSNTSLLQPAWAIWTVDMKVMLVQVDHSQTQPWSSLPHSF